MRPRGSGPLNVLLLAPWMPWPPFDGGRIRTFQTLRHLAGRHRVTLAAPVRSPADADGAARLRGLCEAVVTADLPAGPWPTAARALAGMLRRRPAVQGVHYGRPLAERVRRLTAVVPFDIVQVEFSLFAPYAGAVDPASRARRILSMHNVESLRFKRELGGRSTAARRVALAWDRLLAGDWERRALASFDAATVVSERERRWVERAAPGLPVALVPNGVDTEHFRPAPTPETPRSLVFTGAMDYPPNVDAVRWFCDEVWPRLRRAHPDLAFHVVGRDPAPSVAALGRREGVRVTGEVPDVRPYLAEAAVVVVPLRSGGGTRLKILEGMAMGRPVVATTLGAEGLDVADGRDIVLADTAEAFAAAVLRLLRSPELARRVGAAGRRLAVERYDWRRCLAGLDRLYDHIMAGGRRPAVAGA